MFKKRRQRSKKYTLTSFGSVDEDRYQDSQEEEDGVFPGSESEFDEEGFSAVPDPTWDSDYLDMLEKRATAGTEGRGDGAEHAPSPGLSETAGKGAQLFEQQRKRAAEHAKKVEATQSQAPLQPQVQDQAQMNQLHPEIKQQIQTNLQPQHMLPSGPTAAQQELSQAPGLVAAGISYSAGGTVSMVMSPPPVAPRPAIASVTILTSHSPPAETPLPELSSSNVLNRTARPFTPGFITIRAATAPVTFRPPVTKTNQRPASAAIVSPPFVPSSEQAIAVTSVMTPLPSGPAPVLTASTYKPPVPCALTPEAPITYHPSAISTSVETMQPAQPTTTNPQGAFITVPPLSIPSVPLVPQDLMAIAPSVPQSLSSAHPVAQRSAVEVSLAQPPPPQISLAPESPVSVVSQTNVVAPTPVPGPSSRTGILIDARRRGGKPKPMFNMPDVKKNSPNPELLSMVQNLDDRSTQHKYGKTQYEAVYDGAEEEYNEAGMGRAPPPVAPKPRVIQEAPKIIEAGGKGAQLFARRQSRMGMYVVDTPPETSYQKEVASYNAAQPYELSPNSTHPSQWKYSPNVRAPPPIGYNPLLAPSIPTGPQRDIFKSESRGREGPQREGIKPLDFMRRQPYQLNSAMFNYGGSVANLSAMPSYQRQQQSDYSTLVGSSLTPPKQIPVKTARTYEIKRFSTPTPMSAPTLTPKVIAPRSATTLGERLNHSAIVSPTPGPFTPTPDQLLITTASLSSQNTGLPCLPKFSVPINQNPLPPVVPTPYSSMSYNTGLQTAKQFQSAPELSILASLPPIKTNTVQAPKPRFVATKAGIQPHVWRPGAI